MLQSSLSEHKMDSDASSVAERAGRQHRWSHAQKTPISVGSPNSCDSPVSSSGIQGGSVLFHVFEKQQAELEEITWGFGPGSEYRVLLRVRPGEAPMWVSLQDRYQKRVRVPNMMSLKIENLTSEDSGSYRARGSCTGGVEFTQVFHLTVYEPVPVPKIQVHSSSITPGWCNVTMECRTSGDAEDLKVTWEGKGLPKELEEKVMPGPAYNSHTLAVNLPLGKPYTNITCVVSNQVDQKTDTFDLGRVCDHVRETGSHGKAIVGTLGGILCAVMAVLLFLGTGLYLWMMYKKSYLTSERGLQQIHKDRDDGIDCAELSQKMYQEDMYMDINEQYIKEERPFYTVYSVIHNE
uniref:Ig-like domain-containing protein n=1 Tax=Sus scrofa TaxID=9823 RepID=A0A8D0YVC2_PIG